MTYQRPELKVRAPSRAVGGYYRIIPGQKGGKVFGGMPIQSTEDAVVAAVRTGYRIADAQIERGMRIAQELRGAAKRAGAGEPKDMLTGAESLARQGLLSVMEWLETMAAQPSSPLKRLLSAEYRLLGALIGLGPSAPNDMEALILRVLKQLDGAAVASERSSQANAKPSAPRPTIKFDGKPRAVELTRWEVSGDVSQTPLNALTFARTGDPQSTFEGRIEPGEKQGSPILVLTLSAATPEGRWKAPICGTDGVLLGLVIVDL